MYRSTEKLAQKKVRVARLRPNLGTALTWAKRRFCVKWRRFTTGHVSRRRLMRITPHESHIERPLIIAPGPKAPLGMERGLRLCPQHLLPYRGKTAPKRLRLNCGARAWSVPRARGMRWRGDMHGSRRATASLFRCRCLGGRGDRLKIAMIRCQS